MGLLVPYGMTLIQAWGRECSREQPSFPAAKKTPRLAERTWTLSRPSPASPWSWPLRRPSRAPASLCSVLFFCGITGSRPTTATPANESTSCHGGSKCAITGAGCSTQEVSQDWHWSDALKDSCTRTRRHMQDSARDKDKGKT